ncbi:helix-turn-helix domain-containing protein [Paenibacillus sp. HJGM_3]|uniref:AraC family transcriptional regulator n=1 Tax=Paenibacillus sp. HJGM_3 TaxID=3379816 RepID=UPI00385BA06E
MLALRTNLITAEDNGIPISLYTVGTEHQQPMSRLAGFSARQLFFTLSGTGTFRPIGQDDWDILRPGTMLYIPDHFPHEYRPNPGQPWHVGYATFLEKQPGFSPMMGYDRAPFQVMLKEMDRIADLLRELWLHSGPDYDVWACSERLFALLVEIRKQAAKPDRAANSTRDVTPRRYRDQVVDRATQFMYDHMHLRFSLKELASYVGYSPKQVIRLFKEVHGTTPLQDLQRIRLQTAAELLRQQGGLTVAQVAGYVGMEPIYFARLFRRAYGVVPSKFAGEPMKGSL